MEIKEMVIHTTENGKYKVQFEQAATKGVLGYKVEANGDDILAIQGEASALLRYAQNKAQQTLEPSLAEGK